MWNEMFSAWLTPQGVATLLQGILFIGVFMVVIFRKGIIQQLVKEARLATKDDLDGAIDALRTELLRKIEKLQAEQKADSKELRAELKADIRSIKENDLQHINNDILTLRKALLLLANQSIDDPERIERIKDLLTI